LQEGDPVIFADKPDHETLRRKTEILSTMYDWLEYLAGQSYTSGALISVGHVALVPLQVSCGSQVPVLALQTVPAPAN
jgi:hypothetical protein